MPSPRTLSIVALLTLGACGSPRGSSGSLDPDAGATSDVAATPDVTATTTDAGTATTDVVTTPADVGTTPTDAGTAITDVGTAPVDVGTAPTDVGFARDVPVVRCGDGVCADVESCESCRADCASECPPPPDVPTIRCGDGTCNGGETCGSCAGDCGACMSTGPVTDPCGAGVEQGPNRNCGWRMGVTFSCTPGRIAMVGCTDGSGVGSLCQPSYGSCAGDPVLRVCAGNAPCTAAMALPARSGSFDDQCGACPSAYVDCPSSGQIHVLTGDFDTNNPAQRGTCTAAVR